jgi:hypothetical protein
MPEPVDAAQDVARNDDLSHLERLEKWGNCSTYPVRRGPDLFPVKWPGLIPQYLADFHDRRLRSVHRQARLQYFVTDRKNELSSHSKVGPWWYPLWRALCLGKGMVMMTTPSLSDRTALPRGCPVSDGERTWVTAGGWSQDDPHRTSRKENRQSSIVKVASAPDSLTTDRCELPLLALQRHRAAGAECPLLAIHPTSGRALAFCWISWPRGISAGLWVGSHPPKRLGSVGGLGRTYRAHVFAPTCA